MGKRNHRFPSRRVFRAFAVRGGAALLAMAAAGAFAAIFIPGCAFFRESPATVMTSIERAASEPVFQAYSKATGEKITPLYSSPASAEFAPPAARKESEEPPAEPACDVYWSGDVLKTIELDRAGLLAEYEPENAAKLPAGVSSANKTWHGFSARCRVLLVNTDRLQAEVRPQSIYDLCDPRWKQRCGMSHPLHGTAATHAAVFFAAWGADEAERFYTDARRNVKMYPTSTEVAAAVSKAEIDWGLTDSDAAMREIEAGKPVAIVYPDQEDSFGTLLIPNTVAIMANASSPRQARRVVDYLLSPAAEEILAESPVAQIPLTSPLASDNPLRARLDLPEDLQLMNNDTRTPADFEKAADAWPQVLEKLLPLFGE